jgi:DNA-binding transcriptional ArsR family regulator
MAPKGEGAPKMPDIDKVIHEPARLQIMANLYVVEKADFMYLMRRTGLTFGNLSSHLSKLEAARYIVIEKRFVGKKPQTMVHLSKPGRKAFEDYRKRMTQMLSELP